MSSPAAWRPRRRGIREFLAEAPDSYRIGVVSFASDARVVAPPTRDRELVDLALDELRSGEGTALGDAIQEAVEVGQAVGAGQRRRGAYADDGLASSPTARRTAGESRRSRRARLARERGVPVFTVAHGYRGRRRRGSARRRLHRASPGTRRPDDVARRRRRRRAAGSSPSPTLEQLQEVYADLAVPARQRRRSGAR